MTITRAVAGAALAVIGAALVMAESEPPRYMGDMPSMFADATPAPEAPSEPSAPLASEPDAPTDVDPANGPAPQAAPAPAPAPAVVVPASEPRTTYTGGTRPDPGPGPDTSVDYTPGVGEGSDIGPMPGDPGYLRYPANVPMCDEAGVDWYVTQVGGVATRVSCDGVILGPFDPDRDLP